MIQRRLRDHDVVAAGDVLAWLDESLTGSVMEKREVPPRVRVDTRRSETSVLFDTLAHGFNDAVLHRNVVLN